MKEYKVLWLALDTDDAETALNQAAQEGFALKAVLPETDEHHPALIMERDLLPPAGQVYRPQHVSKDRPCLPTCTTTE